MTKSHHRTIPESLRGFGTERDLIAKYPSLGAHKQSSRFLPIAIALSAIAAVWYLATTALGVPKYILPAPHVVFTTLVANFPVLLVNSVITCLEALAGLALAIVAGFLTSFVIVRSPLIGRAVMPLLAFIQTTPKVAIAPLLLMWLGFGYAPKVAIAFLISFFPIVVATVTGLNSAQRELIELVRSLTTNTREIFLRVQLPSALPYFFSGLKIAVTLSLIGALVGEFVGADRGLGYIILIANGDLNAPMMFSGILIAALMGFILFTLAEWVERVAMPWHASIKPRGPSIDERA